MRRSLPILLALLLALIAAPPALAGGWATVGLDSTPAGIGPGKPWDVNITVLQHGRTPLSDVTPVVLIRSGGVTKEFTATPTDTPGTYHAAVVFPSAGRWTYEVRDGFLMNHVHTFPAVEISGSSGASAAPSAATADAAPAAAAGDGGIATGWLWGAGAALVLALAVLGFDRRRRVSTALPRSPEPAA